MSEKIRILDLVKGSKGLITADFTKKGDKTRNNDPYWKVTFYDNMGNRCIANVWKNLPLYEICSGLDDEDYVEAEIACTEKTDRDCYVDIISIKKAERVEEFVVDIEALKAELKAMLKGMKDKKLRRLIGDVLKREEINKPFFTSPATQDSGYSFKGGLLAHVVRIIKLIKAIAVVFSEWDYNLDGFTSKLHVDFMITVAILHDVGKCRTLQVDNKGKVKKTEEGKLFEDSYVTLKIILEELAKSELPEEQKQMLEHVIGSSKGKQYYGALFVPRSREAIAFNLIEKLDGDMANFEFLDRNAGAEDLFLKLFDKEMFLGVYDEPDDQPNDSAEDISEEKSESKSV